MRKEITDREAQGLNTRWPGQWTISSQMAYRRTRGGITHKVMPSHAGYACTRFLAGLEKTVQHKDPKHGLLEAEDLLRSCCAKALKELND